MNTVLDILGRTTDYLKQRAVPHPRPDAERLLAHVLGVGRLDLYLAFDRPMVEAELAALRPLVARRGQREPIAYITGNVGFHSIDLDVTASVLVPRPDTETLVEAALERFGDATEPVYVADVGTGSGAVALAIAAAAPSARVYATDTSAEALVVARANGERLGLGDRVAWLRGDLLAPIPAERPIDWLVSNPPYIPTADLDGLEPEVSRFEPRLALDGGPDGLDVYRRLALAAAGRVRRGVLFEVGHDQADRVVKLLVDAGFVGAETRRDLAGIPRVVAVVTSS